MDFAIRNKSIYAYNPNVCITRSNPCKPENSSVRLNYSGHDMDADIIEFANAKRAENVDTDMDISTDTDIEAKMLAKKAMKAAKNAQTAKETAENFALTNQDLAEKIKVYCKKTSKRIPDTLWVSSIKENADDTSRYSVSKNLNKDADNAIEIRFGKVRNSFFGKEEKGDIISKKTEIKVSSEAKVLDYVLGSTISKDNEDEFLSYKSRLSCNYDGKPEFYAEGYEYNPLNGIQHWDEYLVFDEKTGKPKHYYTDMTLSSSYERNYGAHLEYRHGQWEKAS